jgi:hypothetical protein
MHMHDCESELKILDFLDQKYTALTHKPAYQSASIVIHGW